MVLNVVTKLKKSKKDNIDLLCLLDKSIKINKQLHRELAVKIRQIEVLRNFIYHRTKGGYK